MRHFHFDWLILLVLIVSLTGPVSGQDYLTKPIRIFASTVGGGTDIAARILAQRVSGDFGQPVLVENRPAFISIETVAKAQPDGYTFLVMGVPVWLAPFLQDNVPWDAMRDFQAITTLTRSPTFLVVHPSMPATSVKELIALVRSRPGEFNYGSGGMGTSTHLAAELFKSMAGVNIERVNYKGAAPAVNGILGGEVHLLFGNIASAQHVKSGKLRVLAVTSTQPSPFYPGLPTVAQSLPGYEFVEIIGLLAPAKTPSVLINRWSQSAQAMNKPEIREKFFNIGSELSTSSPAEFTTAIKADMTRLGKVIKEAGIRAE